jgi:hypothetical protein
VPDEYADGHADSDCDRHSHIDGDANRDADSLLRLFEAGPQDGAGRKETEGERNDGSRRHRQDHGDVPKQGQAVEVGDGGRDRQLCLELASAEEQDHGHEQHGERCGIVHVHRAGARKVVEKEVFDHLIAYS